MEIIKNKKRTMENTVIMCVLRLIFILIRYDHLYSHFLSKSISLCCIKKKTCKGETENTIFIL